MTDSINIEELGVKLGDHCRENKVELFRRALLTEDYVNEYDVLADVNDEVPLPSMKINDIIKAGSTTFTPTDDAFEIDARMLKVKHLATHLRIDPYKYFQSWMAHLLSFKMNPEEFPLEAFIMTAVVDKIKEEFRFKHLYRGTTLMPGYLKIIENEIALGELSAENENLVDTGVIGQTNVIDKFEMIYDNLNSVLKMKPTVMRVNPDLFQKYRRAYRGEFGGNTNYGGMAKDMSETLDGSMCKIVPEIGLVGSNRVIVTEAKNYKIGVKNLQDMATPRILVQHYTIDIMVDYRIGVEFGYVKEKCLVVNNQA
jgi:hypothetical protein